MTLSTVRYDNASGCYVPLGAANDTTLSAVAAELTWNARLRIPRTLGGAASGSWALADNVTIPANITLVIPFGAVLNIASGKTLTINGSIEAELYQIFSGSGTVAFGGTARELYPQWWGAVGDGSTDDTTALQACITCALASAPHRVFIPYTGNNYIISSSLLIAAGSSDFTLEAARGANLAMSGDDYALRIGTVSTTQSTRITIRGLSLSGDGASSTVQAATPNQAGILIGECSKVLITEFRIVNFINGIYLDKTSVLDEVTLSHGRISQIYLRALQNEATSGLDSLYIQDVIVQGSGHGGSSSGTNATIELSGVIDLVWTGGEVAGNYGANGTPATADNYLYAMRLVNCGGVLDGIHFEANSGDIANSGDLRLEGSGSTGKGMVLNALGFQGNNANAAKYAIHTADAEGVTIISPTFLNGGTHAYTYGILMSSSNDQVVIINPMDATPGTAFGTSMLGQAGKYVLLGKDNSNLMHVTGERYAAIGTALVAGDFALSAGWGDSASVGSITANDTRGYFTVTSAGSGQGANPTITLTFTDGAFTTAPAALVQMGTSSQPDVPLAVTTTTTTLVITFRGTPVAAQTFQFHFFLIE